MRRLGYAVFKEALLATARPGSSPDRYTANNASLLTLKKVALFFLFRFSFFFITRTLVTHNGLLSL
jgi:hypothetical protein